MADDSVTVAKHCSTCGVPVGPNGLCPVCLLHRALSDESRILFAPGTTFGQFRIGRVIGKGGMGIVYEATDDLHRAVALKVLPEEYLNDELIAHMFEKEAERAAGLDHPSIVVIYNRGTTDGIPWISMRLLEGDLGALLQSSQLTYERSIAILKQVASALDYAHDRKVVHRDIKPTNILFDRAGNAYVADFGLARTISDSTFVSSLGIVAGTPQYMAPEQARGTRVTAACDIYSLGKVADEMLTASVGSNAPSALPDGMRAAIHKAITTNPQERWTSAGEFVKAVDAAIPRKIGLGWSLGFAASLAAMVVTWILIGNPASDAKPAEGSASLPTRSDTDDPKPPVESKPKGNEAPPEPDTRAAGSGRQGDQVRTQRRQPQEPADNPENSGAAGENERTPTQPPRDDVAVRGETPTPAGPVQDDHRRVEPPAPKPDVVIQPKLVMRVAAVYPAIAKVAEISGDVILKVLVDVNGRVRSENIEVVQGLTQVLDDAARKAVESYEYEPGRRNGIPETMWTEETVKFKLD